MSERDALNQPESSGGGESPAQSLAQRVCHWASVVLGILLGIVLVFLSSSVFLPFSPLHDTTVFSLTYKPDADHNYLLAVYGLNGLRTLIVFQCFTLGTMLAAGVGLLVAIIGTLSGRFKDELLELVNALFICDAIGLIGFFIGAAFTDYCVAGDDFEGPMEAGSFPILCLSAVLLATRLVVTPYTTFSPGKQKLILAFGALCISLVTVTLITHYAAGCSDCDMVELHEAYVKDCKEQTSSPMCM
jgi:hypothetical protein